ncbi:MAG TPA: hypothetical protein DCS21_03600 [Gammaproteobacteria bacterium]|nr:hypothetical protein [Gammaproteobacteria bacterium]
MNELLLDCRQIPIGRFQQQMALAQFMVGVDQFPGTFQDFAFELTIRGFQQQATLVFGAEHPNQQMADIDQRHQDDPGQHGQPKISFSKCPGCQRQEQTRPQDGHERGSG